VKYLAAGLVGRVSSLPEVVYRTARRIEIESEGDEVPVQVDGDARGTTPVAIELAPLRFPVLVPGS
jgi:diacylglycerol kinase family enzyme